MEAFIAAATGVVVALFVGELGGLADRLAVALVRLVARLVPGEARAEYREEWRAELQTVGSGWAKLLFAASLALHALRIRRTIRKLHPPQVHEDEQEEQRYFTRSVMTIAVVVSTLALVLVILLAATSLKQNSKSVAELVTAVTSLNALVAILVFTLSRRAKISVSDEEEEQTPEGGAGNNKHRG